MPVSMRDQIWKSMLDADMNARYWKYLVSRYSKRDKYLKIFLAVMASGSVAGWGFWQDMPAIWKTLSGISALISISLPIFNYQKTIEDMSVLSGKWGGLRISYEDLWIDVNNAPSANALKIIFQKYRQAEVTLQEKETSLPIDEELLKRCYREVKNSRGLK
jgi:hypothetical protein